MSDGGEIPKESLMEALRRLGFLITESEKETVLAKGDIVIAYVLDKFVPRLQVHNIARRFQINIHYFYHPEAIPTIDNQDR